MTVSVERRSGEVMRSGGDVEVLARARPDASARLICHLQIILLSRIFTRSITQTIIEDNICHLNASHERVFRGIR